MWYTLIVAKLQLYVINEHNIKRGSSGYSATEVFWHSGALQIGLLLLLLIIIIIDTVI